MRCTALLGLPERVHLLLPFTLIVVNARKGGVADLLTHSPPLYNAGAPRRRLREAQYLTLNPQRSSRLQPTK
jgi:hypothetical protein